MQPIIVEVQRTGKDKRQTSAGRLSNSSFLLDEPIALIFYMKLEQFLKLFLLHLTIKDLQTFLVNDD